MPMRRMKAAHDSPLPPLKGILPDFTKLPGRIAQNQELLAILKEISQRLRGKESCAYYSMSETAAFFGVSKSVVAQVYTELQNQGILLRLRGFKTILKAKGEKSLHPVHGVVAFPIWLWGYTQNVEWRRFFISLEENLSRHHFVSNFIFFSNDIMSDLEKFQNKLLSHHPDHLFWFKPLTTYKPLIDSLHDSGVQIALFSDHLEPLSYAHYRISHEKALKKAFHKWKSEGINEIIIFHQGCHPVLKESVLKYLNDLGLKWRVQVVDIFSFPDCIESFGVHTQTGLVIPDDEVASKLSFHRSDYFKKMLQQNRVLMHGCIYGQKESFENCPVDIIPMDWETITREIAEDIASGRNRETNYSKTFDLALKIHAQAKDFTCTL